MRRIGEQYGVEIDAQVNIATADVWGPGGEFILQQMDWC